MTYTDMSAVRLLEHLWQDYGRQVAVDGKGRLRIVARVYPPVPVELEKALHAKTQEVRTIFSMEGRCTQDLVT
jgi:hypothetical protein